MLTLSLEDHLLKPQSSQTLGLKKIVFVSSLLSMQHYESHLILVIKL
jgi:hypothetical protein